MKQQQQVVGSDSFTPTGTRVEHSGEGAEPVEQQEAGHDVYILLWKDQRFSFITKSSGVSSSFQVDVFVFYMFGSSSSSS